MTQNTSLDPVPPACGVAPSGSNAPEDWMCARPVGHAGLHEDVAGGAWGPNTFTSDAEAEATLAATGLARPEDDPDLAGPVHHIDTERDNFIDGLLQLADLLALHPEAALPYNGTGSGLLFQPSGAAEFLSTARALGCEWTVSEWESRDGTPYFEVTGHLAGLKVQLLAPAGDLGAGLAALRAEFTPGPVVAIDKAASS